MKRRINTGALLFIALLFSTITLAAPTPPAADNEQIAQLLDQLGVRALLEQTPAILAAAAEAQMKFAQAAQQSSRPSSPKQVAQAPSWRRDLDAQLKPQVLQQEVTRYLRERYNAEMFRQAQQRLQEPLAKRARYFDLAMTQPGVEKNLRAFLRQNHSAQNGAAQNAVAQSGTESTTDARNTEARRTLLREIDTATASSLLMATLQSALAARVQQAVGSGGGAAKVPAEAKEAVDTKLLEDEIAERQRYLAPLAVDYLLYDYRYLRDDELSDYRDLLRDEAVQALLDLSRKALLNAIVGDLTPPPITPQPSQPR